MYEKLNENKMINDKEIVLANIEKIHTTKMGIERIKKNLKLEQVDPISYCNSKIRDKNSIIYKSGKNFYCEIDNIKITINSYSYTIITAHQIIKNKRDERKNLKMTTNLFLIHSLHGNTKESFATSIQKLCNENNINYYYPEFPKGEEANYEEWEKVLDTYYDKGLINENTIIIGHSLGADFIPIYLVKKKIQIGVFISIAGFLQYDGKNTQIIETKNKFNLSEEILQNVKSYTKNRYAIYSDNDPVSPINYLEDYANNLKADKILIPKRGHFGPKSNVKRIEELEKIILMINNS